MSPLVDPNSDFAKLGFDEEFFKNYNQSTVQTMKIQAKLEVTPGDVFVKGSRKQNLFDVAGIVGMSSNLAQGNVALCMPKSVFLRVVSNMTDEEAKEITEENQDAAAELLNIAFAQVKTIMNKKGMGIRMAIPTVLRGGEIESSYAQGQLVYGIPFQSMSGEFYVEISIRPLERGEAASDPNAPAVELTAAEKGVFFKHFVQGTLSALKIQFAIDGKHGQPFQKGSKPDREFDVGSVIGITSKSVRGSYMIGFERAVFLKLASRIFKEEITYMQPGLEDLLCELLNMSLGQAKTVLNKQGHGIQMAIPTIVRGNQMRTRLSRAGTTIVLPFETEIGNFFAELDIE